MRKALIFSSLLGVVAAAITLLGGWSAPPVPPEVKKAEIQRNRLRGTGAYQHAEGDFQRYEIRYSEARLKFLREKGKFIWFRNYRDAAADFRKLLEYGLKIEKDIANRKENNTRRLLTRSAALEKRIAVLKAITLRMNEGRFARQDLMRAELSLADAVSACNAGYYPQAETKIRETEKLVRSALNTLNRILHRYQDKVQIARWLKWLDDTLAESKRKRGAAIIVDKIDRKLILYMSGIPVKTYTIGLGPNGLSNKVHAGDNATPEGRYRVIKKHPSSQYYKALLLDYPNPEDKRTFYQAKKKGLVPAATGPGGWIEIHGGGRQFMTRGCVSLDNPDMEELFNRVKVGTPVTIIGSMGYSHNILATLAEISNVQR